MLNIVVASCWLSSGDVKSNVFVTSSCTHTHLKQKRKKNCTFSQSSCHNEEDVTYGIRAGLTRDLGFSMASVDMIRFDYTVSNQVDCVRASNHG